MSMERGGKAQGTQWRNTVGRGWPGHDAGCPKLNSLIEVNTFWCIFHRTSRGVPMCSISSNWGLDVDHVSRSTGRHRETLWKNLQIYLGIKLKFSLISKPRFNLHLVTTDTSERLPTTSLYPLYPPPNPPIQTGRRCRRKERQSPDKR